MNSAEFERLLASNPGLARFYEWVPSSWRNQGYWRLKPKDPKTVGQLRARLLFSKSAYNVFGQKGFRLVDVDGGAVPMPVAAHAVQKNMKDVKLAPARPMAPLKALVRLREALAAYAT